MYRRLQIYADNSASSSSFSSSSWKEEAMKPPESIGVSLAASKLLKFLVLFVAVPAAFFFLGRRWSSFSPFPHLTFFATNRDGSFPIISISPNANATFDVAFFTRAGRPPLPPPPPSPPPPPKTFGIMGDDGAMQNEFEVGEVGQVGQVVEKWGNWTAEEERGRSGDGGEGESAAKTWRFSKCPARMSEYVPCLDNQEEVRRLKENGSGRGESLERHCPEEGKGLNCLVPAPDGYKQPVPWPRSRDEVWFRNVPHTRLVDDKGGQNWIKREKDKFKFPGGGTQFIHGADQYLNQISEMVPGIAFGSHTRIALDVGCGVASFGAFLLSRNVSTLSVAPKDVHENQIQFALERGVPAMLAAFATRRLLYPSQAFDLIHCSRCRINWIRDGGILLLEVNRMLRAGGYFVWAAQPVYKHEELQQETWKEMEDLTTRICWELVKKEGYIAIWRKPLNNSCYTSRSVGTQPPLCEIEDDPDRVWYVGLKPCISRLPENGYGAQISDWPARLHNTPDRLQDVVMDAHMAKEELFKAETRYWNYIIGTFVRAFRWNNLELRNVMDMRAGFGGFAAALVEHKIDCWVMNVVPTSEPNTLPVIYDRGLLGVAHDWCEPFDTYPRTYDLLHAVGLFSKERKRCDISRILLEMDRMLRPRGRAYFRDTNPVIAEIKGITDAMGWRCKVRDTEEGPYASRRLLTCDKQ